MKFLLIFALAFTLLGPSTVFAQEFTDNPSITTIIVQTDDPNYNEGDTIVISGQVSTVTLNAKVILQLFTEGNLIEIAQIIVAQDGTYSHTVLAEGPLWDKPGNYVVRVSYGDHIAETEFSYTPKSDTMAKTERFEVSAGSIGTFDVEYTIKGGTVKNILVDSSYFSLIVQIDSSDDGAITLDLPREFIGAEKQDGKDELFIILIDGVNVAYEESMVSSESRIITIDFEEHDSGIEIFGTYSVTSSTPYSHPTNFEFTEDKTMDDSNSEGIYSDSIFRIFPEKPNVGSLIRVTGDKFASSQEFDFYIDSKKIGSFVTDKNGHFITTMKIPQEQNDGRVDFTIKDSQNNERTIDLRLSKIEHRISESPQIPFTAEITPSSSGEQPCVGCSLEEIRNTANEVLLKDIPISISTDKSNYSHNEIIVLKGQVVNGVKGSTITYFVISPLNSIVFTDEILIDTDGSFETTVNTSGSMWKYDGTYLIEVEYGDDYADTKIELSGGTEYAPSYSEPQTKEDGIASFVDESKDPQSYVDRYNNEPSYKKWFHDNYSQYDSIEQAVGLELTQKVPSWVKNIFGWYAADQVSETELLNAIKYLINEKILVVD
jgi:hypothetical protein